MASAEDTVPLSHPAEALTAVLLLQEHFADVAGVDEAEELGKNSGQGKVGYGVMGSTTSTVLGGHGWGHWE